MYDIWYCPNYPIESIKFSMKTDRSERNKLRAALAVDIRERGLLNPLIILNHRPRNRFVDHYVMQGLNRLEAVKLLGWDTVPAIVTGECEFDPKVSVEWDWLKDYFFDGVLIHRNSGTFTRPHLIDVTLPQTLKYPTTDVKWNEYRQGVYRHEDYCSIPMSGD